MRPSLKWAKLFFNSVSKTFCGTTTNLGRLREYTEFSNDNTFFFAWYFQYFSNYLTVTKKKSIKSLFLGGVAKISKLRNIVIFRLALGSKLILFQKKSATICQRGKDLRGDLWHRKNRDREMEADDWLLSTLKRTALNVLFISLRRAGVFSVDLPGGHLKAVVDWADPPASGRTPGKFLFPVGGRLKPIHLRVSPTVA